MAKIEVTLSEMTGAADRIKKSAEDFLSVAGQVMASADSLAAAWEGDSQRAFLEEQRAANEWYRQMVDLVNAYVGDLREAARLYEEADQDSAAAIKVC